MDLFFPQWQGCARGQKMYAGAFSAREAIGLSETVDVVVERNAESALQRGIAHRDLLLRHARAANTAVRSVSPATIRTIGGDCGVEVVPVSYLNHRYRGDLGVVWLDAHGDLNTPQSSPSADFHGMPLRTLLGEGDPDFVELCARCLVPEQIVLAGVRDLGVAERDYIERSGIASFAPPTLRRSPRKIVKLLRERGFERIYVHLDADVVEPNDFSDMLMPTPKGIKLETLHTVLRALADSFEIVGHSLLEITADDGQPLRDHRALFTLWSETLPER